MKIEDFYAYPKKVTIMGEEVEMLPITAKYFPLLLKSRVGNLDEKVEATTELAFITLQQLFPKATRENFNKLSTQAISEIMLAFWEVNKDTDEDEVKEEIENVKNILEKQKKVGEVEEVKSIEDIEGAPTNVAIIE